MVPSDGNVVVFLTDKPIEFTGVSAVNVTLRELVLVEADSDGDGDVVPMDMPLGEGSTINLLDFQDGNVVLIGIAGVPAGDYRKLRMLIDHAELVRDDDGDDTTPEITELIKVPPGKIDVPVAFRISGGEEVSITLDFDAELSVHVNTTSGQHPYILRPVINTGISQR